MMKRILAAGASIAALALASAASAATWYVSNTTSNGYTLGVDTNNCTALATPCLTINHAQSLASAADTILVNPSTAPTSNPYRETSGSGYLTCSKAVTIKGDTAYTPTYGKPLLQNATAGQRLLNVTVTSAPCVLQNFVVDGGNSAGGNLSTQANAMFSLLGVDFKNLPSASNPVLGEAAGATVIADKVTLTAANGNSTALNLFAPTNAGISLTLTGSTVSGVNAAVYPFGHNSTTLIKLGASADGTRNTLSNLAYGVVWPNNGATNTNVDIEATDFTGTFTTAIGGQNAGVDVITSLTIKNIACISAAYTCIGLTGSSGSYASATIGYNYYSGSGSYLSSNGTGLSNALISHDTIVQTSATADPISITAGWTGIEIANETITTDQGAGTNTGHAIAIGPDGQGNLAANTATATTTVSLGDVSADAYVAQPVALTIGQGSQIPSSFSFQLSAQGSPTGTITAYLAANSAGVPGSTIETSDLSGITLGTFSASQITSTPTWFQFWLPAHAVLAAGTYHLVIAYTGTNDGANYVKLAANTSTTSTNHSANGTAWSAGSASALYLLQYAAFDIVDPLVHDNTVRVTTTGSTGLHDIALFGTLGGKMYRNQVYGGSIGLISKLSDGSVSGHPLLAYDNLIYQGNSTNNRQGLRDKGSRSFMAYQNSVIVNGDGTASAVTVDNDFDTVNLPQYSAQPSQNFVSWNNVLYTTGAGALASVYALGSLSAANGGQLSAAAVRVVNPTLDYNLIYVGSNYQFLSDARTGTNVNVSTFAAFQALGFGANSVVGDPLLPGEIVAPTAPAGFVPAYNSPAAGIGNPAVVSIVTADFNGTAFRAPPAAGAINLPRRTFGNRPYANGRVIIN